MPPAEQPKPEEPKPPLEPPKPEEPKPPSIAPEDKPADQPKTEEPKPPAPAPEDKPAEPAPPAKPQPKPAIDDPFSSIQGNPLRLWTDISGQYSVEARFVAVLDGDIVRLQRADGRYVRVALNKLSLADQQFVQAQFGTLVAK